MSRNADKIPIIWRLMRWMNQHVMKRNFEKGKAPKVVLMLTTTGRKTGQARRTPLQYEEIDGAYYVASARGPRADWFRNIQANPDVIVQLQGGVVPARAEAVLDAERIADFFEVRLQRHPQMVGRLLRMEGLPRNASREDLVKLSAGKALAVIQPITKDAGDGQQV